MCNRYISPTEAQIEAYWHIGRRNQPRIWEGGGVYPRSQGPFIRLDKNGEPELVIGQWGLIPHFATSPKLKYQTNNARSEELSQKPTYRMPWARGQRCIIPATSFDEPCWETGKNVWWTFERADGAPWGLAGLWNTWVDRETGELHESYTMLTINADNHPLMSRMHKPDPKLGPHDQDKRSVVAIEPADVNTWLSAPQEQLKALIQPPQMHTLVAKHP